MTQYTYLTNEDIGDKSMEGYDCYDPNNEKMGDVDGVITDESMAPRYLVISSGGFFSSKQYVVPFGEIARVSDDDKRVFFSTLTKDTLTGGRYPEYNDQWWETNDHAAWTSHERQVAQAYGHDHPHEREGRMDYTSDLYTRRPEGTQRLQLMEERLRASKLREQAGTVKLGKRITERQETMHVPVTEERVVIERTPATGQAATGQIGADQTIEVPVSRERVTPEKETVVREEVGVRKEAVQHNEQVQGTVRSEQLDVKDGQEMVNDREQRLPGSNYMPDSPTPADKADEWARR